MDREEEAVEGGIIIPTKPYHRGKLLGESASHQPAIQKVINPALAANRNLETDGFEWIM